MGITESNIIKARSGRYKDNEENRRLHRVGQQYGEKKEKVENDGNVFLKYDLQSLKDASEKMSDKINELENQLKQVSDERDKKELMEDLSKLKESSAKVLSAISQKEKQGVKFLRGKDVDKRRKDQIEATGTVETEEEEKKLKEKMKKKLDDLPIGTVISHDGHILEKIEDKVGVEWWKVVESKDPEVVGDGFESREVVDEIASGEDGDFVIESLPMDYLKEQEKKAKKAEKKAEKQGRVYLGEAPNSSKVNLAKYLSAKAKENIDRILGQVIPTKSRAELITMYDDAVKNFNEGFDDMKKAARANMLYQILTIKAALDGKQGDKADIPLASNMSKEEFADYIASERGAARKAEMEAKMEKIRAEHEQKLNALEEEATKVYKSSGVDKVYVGDGAMDMYWEGGGSLAIQGPSKWRPDQDFTVRVPGVGSVYFNSEQAQVFSLAGELLTNTKMKKQALDFLKKYQDIMANTSKIQRETLTQYPDFSSDGTGVRIE